MTLLRAIDQVVLIPGSTSVSVLGCEGFINSMLSGSLYHHGFFECLIKYDLLIERRPLSLYISKLAKDIVLKSDCMLRPNLKTIYS